MTEKGKKGKGKMVSPLDEGKKQRKNKSHGSGEQKSTMSVLFLSTKQEVCLILK